MSAAAMFRTEARVQARERGWVSSAAVSLAMAAVLVVVNRGVSRAVAPCGVGNSVSALVSRGSAAPSPHRLGLWLPPQQPTRE